MMVIELVEGDESRIRWNYGEGWHYADLDDLIRVYESVVRCKDCIHREVQVDGVFRYELCGMRNEIINLYGFCHMGKRREDGLLVTDKD